MKNYTTPNHLAKDQSKIECFVEVWRMNYRRTTVQDKLPRPIVFIESEIDSTTISLFLIKPRPSRLTPSQWAARVEELNNNKTN